MIAQDKKIKETLKNPFDKKIKELKTRTLKNINTPFVFTEIKEYVPNKVYEFTISPSGKNYPKTDIKKIKTICDESDTFSLDFAFALAIIKYLHPSKYTPEGYARKAKEALYIKDYLKVIKYGKKLFGLLQEKEAWEEEQEILKKERHKKYVEKKKRRDNRRKQEEDSRLMNVIRKAIKED